MKLLQDNKKLHADEFSNASPYVIMFGPDKCGATNKVSILALSIAYRLINYLIRSILYSSTRIRRQANMKRSI